MGLRGPGGSGTTLEEAGGRHGAARPPPTGTAPGPQPETGGSLLFLASTEIRAPTLCAPRFPPGGHSVSSEALYRGPEQRGARRLAALPQVSAPFEAARGGEGKSLPRIRSGRREARRRIASPGFP